MRLLAKIALFIGLALFHTVSANAETVTPLQAAQHLGSDVTVEGVVTQVSTSDGGTTFINFGGRYPNQVFYAVIFKSNSGQFPGIYHLEGKTVAISGIIELYRGKPQIVLRSANQITLRN